MNRVITDQDTGSVDTDGAGLNGASVDGFIPDTDDDQQPGLEVEASEGEGSADAASEKFYSGNPEDLPEELYGHYKDMERGFHAQMRKQAEARKGLESDRETLRQQQEELTRLSIQLQARLNAPADGSRDGASTQDEARETGPSREDLIAQVKQKVASGQGIEALFDAVEQLASRNAAGPVVKQFEDKVAKLEERLAEYEGPARIHKETAALNRAFDELKSGQYPQLANDKIVARVREAFEKDDPMIQSLVGSGLHSQAIAFATERALREVTENRTITQARRRRDTAPPRGEAGQTEKAAINSATMSVEDLVDQVLKGI